MVFLLFPLLRVYMNFYRKTTFLKNLEKIFALCVREKHRCSRPALTPFLSEVHNAEMRLYGIAPAQ